jgi:CRISPR-associated protein Cas5t
MGSENVSLRVTAPVCSFRTGYAREYLATERVPPPATVYGFLLSMVGEEDRMRHAGTRLAFALLGEPQISVILRTAWRVKEKRQPPGMGSNRRPDYQEVLTGLELGIWVGAGELADRLRTAARQPQAIQRYGGLSLGESRDLINDIQWTPEYGSKPGRWVTHHSEGNLTLPVWVDHVGSQATVWQSFALQEDALESPVSGSPRWILINPGAPSKSASSGRSLRKTRRVSS